MAFICGSFNSHEEDDFEVLWPFPSTPPRKPTRRRLCRSSRYNNNPYSNRGLDKFEALLADLDDKRQKISTQQGSDISLIRFVYKSPDEVKPIVVKLSDQRKHDRLDLANANMTPTLQHRKDVEHNGTNEAKEVQRAQPLIDECKKNIRFDQWRRKLGEWWQPSYYFPFFVIMILVLLIFSGRSFTILCTSLGWYLVPVINKTLQNSKKPDKIMKKEYARKLRDKQRHKRSF